uniref:Phosphate transport system permease protein n=1 Tax=uncultured bacterium F25-01 TaxID=1191433 RepID=I3VIF9_9BACT|nr:phosphate transport system permease protein PstC [uncultured bacterium F25-01]
MVTTTATTSADRGRTAEIRAKLSVASTGRQADRLLIAVIAGCAILLLLIVGGIAASMIVGAAPALSKFGFGFLVSSTWDPVNGEFGALPFIFGTLVTSLLGLLIGAPIALAAAIALADLVPPATRSVLSALVELLAAIPSVVYGLWGIFVLAPILRTSVEPFLRGTLGFLPLFSGPAYGVGMLAGGLILAIMILPTIAAVSRDVILAVPRDQREGMLAIGATQWEMIWGAVLPYARPGILGGIILGLGRALGETMAVTMLIGNRPEISASLFAPSYTMASVIANEFTEATSPIHVAALMEIGLVLFGVSIVVNAGARLLVWRIAGGSSAVGTRGGG